MDIPELDWVGFLILIVIVTVIAEWMRRRSDKDSGDNNDDRF